MPLEQDKSGGFKLSLAGVCPEAVTQSDERMWGVDYSKLVPLLVKAVQELRAEVQALKGN